MPCKGGCFPVRGQAGEGLGAAGGGCGSARVVVVTSLTCVASTAGAPGPRGAWVPVARRRHVGRSRAGPSCFCLCSAARRHRRLGCALPGLSRGLLSVGRPQGPGAARSLCSLCPGRGKAAVLGPGASRRLGFAAPPQQRSPHPSLLCSGGPGRAEDRFLSFPS